MQGQVECCVIAAWQASRWRGDAGKLCMREMALRPLPSSSHAVPVLRPLAKWQNLGSFIPDRNFIVSQLAPWFQAEMLAGPALLLCTAWLLSAVALGAPGSGKCHLECVNYGCAKLQAAALFGSPP